MNSVKLFSAVVIATLGLVAMPLLAGAQTIPTINSISPNAIATGSGSVVIYIYGSGYVNGSWVSANGAPIATGYASPSLLTATVPNSYTDFPGSLAIMVNNPAWVTGNIETSNTAILTVTGNPPVAMGITNISPVSAMAGSSLVVVTVNGFGFVNGASVSYNGLPLFTSFVSSNQLFATIPASYLTQTGSSLIRVTNPGGTASNSFLFTVTSMIPGLPNTGFGPTDGQNSATTTPLALAIGAIGLGAGAIVVRRATKQTAK